MSEYRPVLGAGSIALPLARQGRRGRGVEIPQGRISTWRRPNVAYILNPAIGGGDAEPPHVDRRHRCIRAGCSELRVACRGGSPSAGIELVWLPERDIARQWEAATFWEPFASR